MEHHERALSAFVERCARSSRNLAVIVSGSVARGTERADSDVDLYLVVEEEAFAEAEADHRVMYTDTEGIDYPGGYFDVKLCSVAYLFAAIERADDPTRASFQTSRIVWSRIPDLQQTIDRVTTTPEEVWRSHEASFAAQARLHGEYFLPGAERDGDVFLAASAAVHLATAACRALLAKNRVSFSGPKYLVSSVAALPGIPSGFIEAVTTVVTSPSAAHGARVLALLESAGPWPIAPEHTLSLFVEDNELAWLRRRVPPEYR